MIHSNKIAKLLIVLSLIAVLLLLFACVDKNQGNDKSVNFNKPSKDLTIIDGTVRKFGEDEHIVIGREYKDKKITKIQVNLWEMYGICHAKTLSIPDTVEEITKFTYDVLQRLEAFYVDDNNRNFKSVDGVLYSKDGTVLLRYPAMKLGEIYVIPDGVKYISYGAFSGNDNLKEIVIPKTVVEIDQSAFSSLNGITELTIPDSVVSIGESAFAGNIAMTKIKLSENLTSIGKSAFMNCKSLSSITLPDSLKTMGIELFQNCSSLSEIKLPEGITFIPEGMFVGCGSLKNYTVPSSVKEIQSRAFRSSGIENITLPKGLEKIGWWVFEYCHSLKSITLPASIKTIDAAAFQYCKNLKSVTFLGGGVTLSAGVFDECESLSEVHIPSIEDWLSLKFENVGSNPLEHATFLYANGEFVKDLVIPEGTTTIGSYQFYKYKVLTSVVIPEGVKTISNSAFCGCWNLKEIAYPSTLTSLGIEAFSGCTKLETVYMPSLEWWLALELRDSPCTYAKNVYVGGELVTEVVIPDEVERIKDYTFCGCDFITSIYVPKWMISFGYGSFSGCDSLETIVFGGTVEQWEKLMDRSSSYWKNSYGDTYTVICTDGTVVED